MKDLQNRRKFIGSVVGMSGAFALGACKTIGQQTTGSSSTLKVMEIDPLIPKRQEFNSLPSEDKRAFIEAVRAMHTKKLTVPANFGNGEDGGRELSHWQAQADSHRWYCDHGTWKFLPWHRAYLHCFELHLRKHIRDTFRLPYWDWTTSVDVPIEIQDKGTMDFLGIYRDANNLNDDKELFLNAKSEILSVEDFDTIGGDASSSGMIEGPYHNMVHVYLGGQMGRVPTAAQDPFFGSIIAMSIDYGHSGWIS